MTADPGIGQHFCQKDEVKFSMNLPHLYLFYPFIYLLRDLELKTYLLTNQTGDHGTIWCPYPLSIPRALEKAYPVPHVG
jgi:hypothetical protein